MSRKLKKSCFLLFYVFSLRAFAYDYVGAVSTATAGSGRATFDRTEAPSQNPAAVAHLKGYFFNTGYATLDKGNQFYVSLTDNLPDTLLPSSIQYSQWDQKTKNMRDWSTQKIQFGVGNYIANLFALGFGLQHRIDSFAATKYTQTNLRVGTLYNLNSKFSFALVFENILEADSSIPKEYRFFPGTSIGASYLYQKLMRIRFDLETPERSNSFNYPSLAAAMETYWNRWIILRFSARKELETKIDQYGGGISFVGPKFALHYGYIQSPQDEKLTRHAVDLAIPIW